MSAEAPDREVTVCPRHPDREVGLRCTRCGQPSCWECLRPAPVGSHCVDCLRGGGTTREVRAPWRRSGARPAVLMIIAACVAVFLFQSMPGAGVTMRFSAIGAQIADGELYRMVTSMFLHHGVMHLGMNMLALWIYGSEVEADEGPLRLMGVFLATGVAGSAVAYLYESPFAVAAGASGAVFGLLGVALVRVWRRRGDAGPLLTILAINLVIGVTIPNISLAAHAGGFVAGVAYALVTEVRTRPLAVVLPYVAMAALVAASIAVVLAMAPAALA